MSAEQEIKYGQTWERIRDGLRVVVTAYNRKWDDVRYRRPSGSSGAIYGCYFRARYRLVPDDDTPAT